MCQAGFETAHRCFVRMAISSIREMQSFAVKFDSSNTCICTHQLRHAYNGRFYTCSFLHIYLNTQLLSNTHPPTKLYYHALLIKKLSSISRKKYVTQIAGEYRLKKRDHYSACFMRAQGGGLFSYMGASNAIRVATFAIKPIRRCFKFNIRTSLLCQKTWS